MQSKESGYHRAAANVRGRAPEYPEEQQNVDGVQQQVYVVLPAGVQAEELTIERVGEPRQRMPVRSVVGGECPPHSLPAQSGLYVRVLYYINVVIKAEKWMSAYRVIKGYNGNDKTEATKQDGYAW